jgi:translocation and assembly module TamB
MKILKVLALACGVLVLMLAGVLLAVRYLFPAEEVRRELEQILSQQLQGHVRIATLEWELLSAIQLGAVEMERDGARFARFDRLVLRYDLQHLLHGKLSVNELVLTRAEVFLDLAHLPVKSETEPAAKPPAPTTLPTLPLAVSINTIRIEDSQVSVAGHDGLRLTLDDVDLMASLSAGPNRADLSGTFDVADIEVVLHKQQLRFPLHLEFVLAVDFQAERLVIDRLDVQSDPVMSLSVNGQLDHMVSSREMTLSVQDGRIDLERLLLLAQPFLPPPLLDAHVAGTISPTGIIKGSQTERGFDGTVEVDLRGIDIRGTVPAFKFALEPTSFRLHAGEALVRANLPRAIRADLSIDSRAASSGTNSLRNLAVEIQADRAESGRLSAHVAMTGTLSAALPPSDQAVSEPVELAIDASADETHMSFSLAKVAARVGDIVHLLASGEVGALDGASNERPFGIKASVETDVTKLLSALPRSVIGGITLASRSGHQRLTLDLTGTLDPEWRPQRASADASLEAAGLHATLVASDVSGTLDRMGVDVHATYGAKAGSLMATLSGRMGLAEMKQGASLALGTALLKFNGRLKGRVTPAMGVSRLTASHRLQMETRHTRYLAPGMSGRLDRMTASSDIEADIMEGSYRLKSLRIAAGDLLDCIIKGGFQSKNQQFSVDVSMPSFNLAQLGNHVSGPDVQALVEVAPSGRLSLDARGSGTIPRPEQVAKLQIPVTAFMNLDMHDIAGAYRDRRITGVNGAVRISMEHKDRQKITSSVKVQVNRLDMGSGLPIKQLNKLSVDLGLSAEDFDDLTLDRLIVGADGVEAKLEGEVSGVKRLLTRKDKPLPTLLGPVFVKMRSNANIDLDKFQDVARSYGLIGSGRAGFSMSLLKRERGPLDVRLSLLPRRLSLTKDSNHVEEFDGAIEVRKVFQWIPALNGHTPESSFTPTRLLPDLRAASPSRQDIHIRQVEAGALQAEDLSAGLFFDRNRFVLQDLAMTMLDGGLGGEVVLTGGKGFGLNMRLEATRIDMNRLLPLAEQIRGDSLIDGTLTASVLFDASSGRLDLGGSKLDLSLSRIGQDGLDRVLRFLDQKGSNPSIVGARSAVKLANPSSAQVTLSKGLVGLQILFQEGLLSRFKMDRIPIGQIKQVQNFTENIPHWNMIRRIMEVVGAEHYGVDQEGEFVLQ